MKMVGSTLRYTLLSVLLLLLPILLLATPVAAGAQDDECAGGVDASNQDYAPSPLEVYGGCYGRLYDAPGGSTNHGPDDFRDVYGFRQNGTGYAKIDFQICNLAPTGHLVYEVWWKSDVLTHSRMDKGILSPGTCSSAYPLTVTGGYKPGDWTIRVYSFDSEIEDNKTMDYWLYAIPLWR